MVLRQVLLDAVKQVDQGHEAPGTDAITYRAARAVDDFAAEGCQLGVLEERAVARV